MQETKDLAAEILAPDVELPEEESVSPNEGTEDAGDQTVRHKLDWNAISIVSSGIDNDGDPLSAATASLCRVTDDGHDLTTITDIELEGAAYDMFARGGALVLDVHFPRDKYSGGLALHELCLRYFRSTETEKDKGNTELTVTFVPLVFHGDISFLFIGLVYEWYETDNGLITVHLVFDQNATITLETDEIDYQQIIAEVDAEIRRMDLEIEAQLEEALEEEKQLQESNIVAESLAEEMQETIDLKIEDAEKGNDQGETERRHRDV